MDLSKFVTEEPPLPKYGPRAWERRFEDVIAQGLSGRWINATEAWGVGPGNAKAAENAADRCGVTISARVYNRELHLCVK
jgi:hypothetical protein